MKSVGMCVSCLKRVVNFGASNQRPFERNVVIYEKFGLKNLTSKRRKNFISLKVAILIAKICLIKFR
jgi:hypothetical protein